MKKLFIFIIIAFTVLAAKAQSSMESSKYPTQYQQFEDAQVFMALGDTINTKANIFLKNGHLYFLRNKLMMEADMNNVVAVQFKDRRYIRIDTLLAAVVGTYKDNQLLCSRMIDIQSYITLKKNAQVVTGLELSLNNYINVQHIDTDLGDEEFPIHRIYFFYYNGKYVPVNDRELYKYIPKEKRSVFNNVTKMDEFDWYDEAWLMKLLKYITL